MDENMNVKAEENRQEQADATPLTPQKQEQARKAFKMPGVAVRGVIKLYEPLLSKNKPVEELHYDFGRLTGSDMIECLDVDPMVDTGRQISHKQSLYLFARACGKVEREISGLDQHDVMERIGARDMVACVRAARVFFAHALGGALLSTFDA